MRPVRPASALVLALLLGGARARAQTNPHPWRIADEYGHVVMRLRYTPPKGCPNEDAMEGAVSIAVPEWHPFAPDAPWILVVDVRRRPQGWEGTAELHDAATDRLEWNASMPPRRSCKEVLLDLAEVLAIYIDSAPGGPMKAPAPAAPASPAPPPEPAPPPAPPPPEPAPAPVVAKPAPPPPPKRNVGFVVGVDADFNPLLAPTGLAGGSAWVALRLRDPALSFEAGLRGMGSVAAGQVQTPLFGYVPVRWTYVGGVLAGALHRGPLFAGPLLEVGSLTARSTDPMAPNASIGPPVVGLGLRIDVERAVGDLFVVRTVIEGSYVLAGPRLLLAPPLPYAVPETRGVSSTVALGIGLR
jgi:hypothetical protein